MAASTPRNFDLIRRLRVADYVTLMNGEHILYRRVFQQLTEFIAVCGVFSIFLTLEGSQFKAFVLIYLGYEFDRLDGIVARRRNETSELGRQLDSLSDLVTFGAAPMTMWYFVGFGTPVDKLVLTFYLVGCIARLARFNVAAHLSPKDARGKALYFEGLPISYAGLAVSSSITICERMGWARDDGILRLAFSGTWLAFHPATIFVGVISAMMISKRLRVTINGTVKVPVLFLAICVGLRLWSPL